MNERRRALQRTVHPARQTVNQLLIIDMGRNDSEFIAAEKRHRIRSANAFPQSRATNFSN